MSVSFKIALPLLERIHADLSRHHSVAYERVGFLACGVSQSTDKGILLLAESYHPVQDDHYMYSDRVGALIGPAAIRHALEIALARGVSMVHIHRHEHLGGPSFSRVDRIGNADLIPSFFNVAPRVPHAAVVLSKDSMYGECWLPGKLEPVGISRFSIVGMPTTSVGEHL